MITACCHCPHLWAYLLLKRQHPIPRDYLAYTLWPDVTEEEARANLRRHLHLLRKQLPAPSAGTPWILTEHNTVQWNPEAPYWLDVALLDNFNPATASEAQWAEVIDCYRGDLLAGLYDDWVLAERAHLHQRYIQLLEQRVAQQRSRGEVQGAIAAARRLLTHDPLREEPYRYLMELYYWAGDRAAALREFENCKAMLRTELGAEPMPETLALRDSILKGEALPPFPRIVPAQAAQARLSLQDDLVATSNAQPPTSAARIEKPPGPRHLYRWLGAGLLLLLLTLLGLAASGLLPLNPTRQPVTTSISGPMAVQDTWLNGQIPDLPYDPNYSKDLYAIYPQVHLSYWNYPYDRVLIRFDLSSIPADANIKQAVFHLHLETFLNEVLTQPFPATVSAFRLLVPWEQDTATFNTPWSQPGLAADTDYQVQALGSDSLHGSDWLSIDVTEAVRHWLAHPDQNFGLLIMITSAPRGAHYWADTSDYPLSNRRPHLDITYLP